MKTRDRVLSAAIVGGIIAFIWWGGSHLRNVVGTADAESDATPSTSTPASVAPKPTVSAAPSGSAIPSPVALVDAGPPPMSGACRTMQDASTKKLADAKAARACTPDFDASILSCITSQNGATWGLRVDDVVDLGTSDGGECRAGWLVRLIHLDVNGAEAAIVPGISATKLAHTYDVDSVATISDVSFFDWDGDGEDEVFVHATRGADHRSSVWTFKNADAGARIAPYAPAANIDASSVRDVDHDGRPDLIVKLIGTHEFVAHSLADGTFSFHDAAATAWAEKQCPTDPEVDLTQTDDATADAITCKLVWGHDAKTLGPIWTPRFARVKAPLSLR